MSDSAKYVTACRNAMRAINKDPERTAAILDAVSRLSPAVRELLLANPDAVQNAVSHQHLLALGDITDGPYGVWNGIGQHYLVPDSNNHTLYGENETPICEFAASKRDDAELVAKLLNSATKLSPSVQQLFLDNPEAVERAVELAIAHKAMIATPCNEPNVMDIALLTKACVEAEINSIAALSPKMEVET